MCVDCTKFLVCKIADKLAVFGEEAKKDLGVNITIDQCKEFTKVETNK